MGDNKGAAEDEQMARTLGASPVLLRHTAALEAYFRADFPTAFRLFAELIRDHQETPSDVVHWAEVGFLLRRDSEVSSRFAALARSSPTFPQVIAVEAAVKARDGDLTGAIARDRAGLKIAPYSAKLRTQLAAHLCMSRQWQDALKAAESALEASPNDYAARGFHVRCLVELGRGADAKAALDRLTKDFPARSKDIDDFRQNFAGRLPK
jgi:tetratricopeptide (TPR) repeat protein